jgi:hypothetical protein
MSALLHSLQEDIMGELVNDLGHLASQTPLNLYIVVFTRRTWKQQIRDAAEFFTPSRLWQLLKIMKHDNAVAACGTMLIPHFMEISQLHQS